MIFLEVFEALALMGAATWGIILFLPWRPWSTREEISSLPDVVIRDGISLCDITVLIPARNEADSIEQTLKGLKRQGDEFKILVIDDQSTDQTRELALKAGGSQVDVISGTPLPEGWAGKLWALEQGRARVQTPYTLLIDADIDLLPGILKALKLKMEREGLDLVSLMVELRMQAFWEKLLIPSFIYFFKLLYPFAWGNHPRFKFGVAAGGCILLRTKSLDAVGGFGVLRDALIDDCKLAQTFKVHGFRTFVALTRSARSHRSYENLETIWNMVARSAFTQLGYSRTLLGLVTVIMSAMFIFAPLGLLLPFSDSVFLTLLAGNLAMAITYTPTLRFYGLSRAWAFLMPVIGCFYMAMTWSSALRYWRGARSVWKGRVYSPTMATKIASSSKG